MGQDERGRLGQPLASRKPPVDLKGLGASLCLLVFSPHSQGCSLGDRLPVSSPAQLPCERASDPAGSALFPTSGPIADPAEIRLR